MSTLLHGLEATDCLYAPSPDLILTSKRKKCCGMVWYGAACSVEQSCRRQSGDSQHSGSQPGAVVCKPSYTVQ